MGGLREIENCREQLKALEKLMEDVGIIRERGMELDTLAPLARGLEGRVRDARLKYLDALGKSVVALDGMPERMRSVMWRRYVMGMSITETAEDLHYARRSICRLQKAGVAWLEKSYGG